MKLSKKGKIIIACSLIVVILSVLFLTIKTVKITLIGENKIDLLLSEEYEEKGFKAQECHLFICFDITDKVEINNPIATDKIGTYDIIYGVKANNKTYEIKRTVNIYENVAPTIELKGSSEINACLGHPYEEEGFIATDNYDGDITSKVTKEYKNDGIYYQVVDSSNNVGEIIRKYNYVDQEKPTLTLNGEETIYLAKGETFTDPGAKANDNCDGNLTNNIQVKGSVDTSQGGTYTLTYIAKDALGNETSKERKVIVYDFETKDLNTYMTSLEAYIKVKGYKVSIGYYNINKDYTYKYNADKIYYGASLIKTLDALYVYEKMNLTDNLRALVKPTIEKSDNNTHRKLVEIIGINNIREYGKSMGATQILNRYASDYYGNTIVDDQLIYMKYLYNFINNESVDAAKREELKNYFINKFNKYLKFDGAPTIMHKYGYYSVYYHDVGIVLDNEPYIVVILTEEATHDFKIVTDLSEKIYYMHKLV